MKSFYKNATVFMCISVLAWNIFYIHKTAKASFFFQKRFRPFLSLNSDSSTTTQRFKLQVARELAFNQADCGNKDGLPDSTPFNKKCFSDILNVTINNSSSWRIMPHTSDSISSAEVLLSDNNRLTPVVIVLRKTGSDYLLDSISNLPVVIRKYKCLKQHSSVEP